MEPWLQLAAGRMSALVALDGGDVVAAFVKGGFRVARRERGLALLVRGVQVVVVPETGRITTAKLHGLLQRAEVEEKDLLSWLARTGAPAPCPRVTSGFHQKTPAPSEPPPPPPPRHALASSQALQKSLQRWQEALREVDDLDNRDLHLRKR